LKQETAVKGFLTAKVRDLEGEVDRLRRKGREVLQEAVLTERDHVTSLQWELEECRAALHAAEETAHTYQVCSCCFFWWMPICLHECLLYCTIGQCFTLFEVDLHIRNMFFSLVLTWIRYAF
jgi:hypothetical protein